MPVTITLTASSSDALRIATALGFTGSSSQGNIAVFVKSALIAYFVTQVTAHEGFDQAQIAYAAAFAAAVSSSAQVVVT